MPWQGKETPLKPKGLRKEGSEFACERYLKRWCRLGDSNPRPHHYETHCCLSAFTSDRPVKARVGSLTRQRETYQVKALLKASHRFWWNSSLFLRPQWMPQLSSAPIGSGHMPDKKSRATRRADHAREVEASQLALRVSIAETERLVTESDKMLRRHPQELDDDEVKS